MHELAAQCKKL
jgi:nucleoside-diphosphate-sugar epimerase